MNKTQTSAAARGRATAAAATVPQGESVRDSVEAVVVAVILTLTFRTFLGENYQIPTGSMAPTLQGRHMDVVCDECGYQYRTGASVENETDGRARGEVRITTCPICRFPLNLDKANDRNERSFAGDRIIVSKLAYLFAEPQRWDVFVFKYPGDPKVNYIKRLVGLPGEVLKIRHGDLHTLDPTTADEPPNRQGFRIARKPAEKVAAMLQLVDDTYYLPESLEKVGWPSRWSAVTPGDAAWQNDSPGTFSIPPTTQDSWLGYRHLLPRHSDWTIIEDGQRPDLTGFYGQLITDYYEYNDGYDDFNPNQFSVTDGWNWVGDLAMEAHAEVLSDSGELLFDLVEGGIHHRCRIDIATGRATMSLDDGRLPFRDDSGQPKPSASGGTKVRGRGSYVIKFANVDDQLFLWVNGQVVSFDGPTTFDSPPELKPHWTEQEPGDISPARIGSRQAEVRVDRLRVMRDVYYVAATIEDRISDSDYGSDWENIQDAMAVLRDPRTWATTDLFASRRERTFRLERDQFFPMGDNSPQSKDGRLWSVHTNRGLEPPPFVPRAMLIGKAVFIYWPHSWDFPKIPFLIPNFQRIGPIR
jgi:signal peptidase I